MCLHLVRLRDEHVGPAVGPEVVEYRCGTIGIVALALQDLLSEGDDPDRSATVFDYLWAHGRPHVLVSEPDEVKAHGVKLTAQVQASYAESLAKGNKPAAPESLVLSWDEVSRWLEDATSLEMLSIDDLDADRQPADR